MTLMNLNSTEAQFLDQIKQPCQNQMHVNKILASVTAAQAIYESRWGRESYVSDTNNLFRVLIDDEWNGYCYSLDTKKMYEKKTDCTGPETLIKVYDSYDQCIEDWIFYIVSARRSDGGPLKYKNVIGVSDYKQCIKNYIRDGYIKDHLNAHNDPSYESDMIGFIEKYELFKWDKDVSQGTADLGEVYYVKKNAEDTESLYATNSRKNAEYMARNNQGYKVFSESGELILDPWDFPDDAPMYRVRLSWNDAESQIAATKIIEDAKVAAESHTGYKVFVNEDGTVVYDPWEEGNKEESDEIKTNHATVLRAGDTVSLSNTPVFRNADDKNPFIFLTGEFYYFDANPINGRIRITKSNDFVKVLNGKDPSKVVGMITL